MTLAPDAAITQTKSPGTSPGGRRVMSVASPAS